MYSDKMRLQDPHQLPAPLKLRDQLRIPPITMELIKTKLALPDSYCGTCTLREGMTLTLIAMQAQCVAFIALACVFLFLIPEWSNRFWHDKFMNDFDHYVMNENQEFINKIWPLWVDVTYLLIIAHGTFFFTGLMATYGLNAKDSNPLWYVPWLFMSGFLCLSVIVTGFTILVCNMILYTYREITVTWDIVPNILVFIVGYFWAYGFFVSVAHYRRRCIVRYWKDSQRKFGTLDM